MINIVASPSNPDTPSLDKTTTTLRTLDLCAGLGGFGYAIKRAEKAQEEVDCERRFNFRCVLAAELEPHLRELYVANFPEIRDEYETLYPRAACATVPGMEDIYSTDGAVQRIHGDIASLVDMDQERLVHWPPSSGLHGPIVPEHDLLCAGFPCQPFSKSGAQRGFEDLNGTVFSMIAVILRHRRPSYVLLENVGNFERHDSGNTWKRVREVLEEFGYSVRYTKHVGPKRQGAGLLSPHHVGHAHHRERFFVVAQQDAFVPGTYPFPLSYRFREEPRAELQRLETLAAEELQKITEGRMVLAANRPTASELQAAEITPDRVEVIDHWNSLLHAIERKDPSGAIFRPMPSFPIWGFELDPWQHYPAEANPQELVDKPRQLLEWRSEYLAISPWINRVPPPRGTRGFLAARDLTVEATHRWVDAWPGYAKSRKKWPRWKRRFIQQNRAWGKKLWQHLDPEWLRMWMDTLLQFVPSHQKLEWNCQGEIFDLWRHLLQFRPSGLRVKRFGHVPALVAMTSTQIPIVPKPAATPGRPRARHLLAIEALQLQGFPPQWRLPPSREQSFRALGNAVHAQLVKEILLTWLCRHEGLRNMWGDPLLELQAGAVATC